VLQRLVQAGADRICLIVNAYDCDVAEYFGDRFDGTDVCLVECA